MSRAIQALGVSAVALTVAGLLPPKSRRRRATCRRASRGTPVRPGLRDGGGHAPRPRAHRRAASRARLATEAAAPVVEKRLRDRLGATFGGAWIPAGATRLTVAVTSAAGAARCAPRAPYPKSSPAAKATSTPPAPSSTAAAARAEGTGPRLVRRRRHQQRRRRRSRPGAAAQAARVRRRQRRRTGHRRAQPPSSPGRCTTSAAATST